MSRSRAARRCGAWRAAGLAGRGPPARCWPPAAASRARTTATGAGQADDGRATRRPRVGTVTFSNWPLYIDKKTDQDFDRRSAATIKYIEDYNDNEEFFAKVRQELEGDRPDRPRARRR